MCGRAKKSHARNALSHLHVTPSKLSDFVSRERKFENFGKLKFFHHQCLFKSHVLNVNFGNYIIENLLM